LATRFGRGGIFNDHFIVNALLSGPVSYNFDSLSSLMTLL